MQPEFDPRISPCTEAAIMNNQQALIDKAAWLLTSLAVQRDVASDFINGLLADNPDLVEGLPRLPTDVSNAWPEHDHDAKDDLAKPSREESTDGATRSSSARSRCSRPSGWGTNTKRVGPRLPPWKMST